MNWVTYLQSWAKRILPSLKQLGIDAIFSTPTENTDNNSIHADFDTNEYIGRITLWESGECDMEILDIVSEDTILSKHYVFVHQEDAEQAVSEFINRLCQN